MKFETYLLLTVIIVFMWKTRRSVQRSLTMRERYFAIRTSIFTWFVGFLLLMALLFLPNKARILLVIPILRIDCDRAILPRYPGADAP